MGGEALKQPCFRVSTVPSNKKFQHRQNINRWKCLFSWFVNHTLWKCIKFLSETQEGISITWVWRKCKWITSKTIGMTEKWLPGQSPKSSLYHWSIIFSLMAQNIRQMCLWSRHYEGLFPLPGQRLAVEFICICPAWRASVYKWGKGSFLRHG